MMVVAPAWYRSSCTRRFSLATTTAREARSALPRILENAGVENPVLIGHSDGASIAYQVMGDGPPDIVMAPGLFSHVELYHDFPDYHDFFAIYDNCLARFSDTPLAINDRYIPVYDLVYGPAIGDIHRSLRLLSYFGQLGLGHFLRRDLKGQQAGQKR